MRKVVVTGGAVAEMVTEYPGSKAIFKRLGINDSFCKQVGTYEYLRELYALSIIEAIIIGMEAIYLIMTK